MPCMKQVAHTIAALAVDTDDNPATGTETLMGLTVQGADVVYEFNAGNPDSNLITGTFPAPANNTFKIGQSGSKAGEVMNGDFPRPG